MNIDELITNMEPDQKAAFDRLPNGYNLLEYIYNRVPLGGFMEAAISNDLRRACERADMHNQTRLHDYVFYLYNYAPGDCWGSQNAYQEWIS